MAALLLLAGNHLGWRTPVRPFRLARHLVRSGPLESRLAGADAVAACLPACLDEIKEVLPRIDDDRARLVGTIVVHNLR